MSTPEDESSDRADTRWSEADKRLLLITFAGGLAANIGVLLVVGAAIAIIRVLRSPHNHAEAVVGIFIATLTGVSGAALGYRLFPNRNPLFYLAIIYTIVGLLCLIGYAVGIAK
jgi:hypothetical protein